MRTDRRVLINTGALAGSSLWRIGLSFLLQILIATKLGASGLGSYTTALAYLNVCQVLSEIGLPPLLVRNLARRPERRRFYFFAALILQLGSAILFWLLLSGLILLLPYPSTTRLAMIVITASLPFYAVTSVCETLFQAGERMELVMGVEMTVNTLIVASSILLLWQGYGVIGLAAVFIGSQLISALLCLFLLRRSGLIRRRESQVARQRRLTTVIPALMREALPFYGLSLSNVLLHRLDVLLLNPIAGDLVTGIYSAAYLIVRVPVVLAQTYWQALYPTLSRLRVRGLDQYRKLTTLSIRYGLLALIPLAMFGGLVSESILALIFSDADYQASAPALRILFWAAPLYLLATYAVNLLLIERKPGSSLLIALVHIGAVLLLLPPLALWMGALGAAIAVLAAFALSAGWGLMLLRRRGQPIPISERLPQILIIAAISGATTYALIQFGSLFWPLAIAAGALLYLLLIWRVELLSTDDVGLFRKALM